METPKTIKLTIILENVEEVDEFKKLIAEWDEYRSYVCPKFVKQLKDALYGP